ncbi:MAG: restriction system-associated AAA family ATPase [Planctomycetales bacterium]|nr:restriction system-associated AAA family ATPase [Planctomycetales bacterium]
MKLIRLKLTDDQPFRSLQPGFEYHFRSDWELDEELNSKEGVSPFVCAGRNGSGKSNLLELLAAIFFQLETHRVWRDLPATYVYDEEFNSDGIMDSQGIPDAYELEYSIALPRSSVESAIERKHVRINKVPGSAPVIQTVLKHDNGEYLIDVANEEDIGFLLPEYVVGYSSGENELLSLPFFKMRFIQYDEYWSKLKSQLDYPGRPETRLAFLDNSFSQAILLCNLLYEDDIENADERKHAYERRLSLLCSDVGLEELKEFRIIIKRQVSISDEIIMELGENHPALRGSDFAVEVELTERLERNEQIEFSGAQEERGRKDRLNRIINKLQRCATSYFSDPETGTLYLDYFVNSVTRQAFRDNFGFKVKKSPIELFHAFQVLLFLNLYSVSDELKADLYKSDSHYVSETVPTLASDERIMRFKFVQFTKEGVDEPVMLKSLSDGEHQLLHSLGLCLLFKNTNCLFLLDEPETHFNPDWRSSFISRLRKCFGDSKTHEMLITTHSPFLISDSKRDRVLLFRNEDGRVNIIHPEYKTLGASINFITAETFRKKETIGQYAESQLDRYRERFDNRAQSGEQTQEIIADLHRQLGDSIEKVLLIQSMLAAEKETE